MHNCISLIWLTFFFTHLNAVVYFDDIVPESKYRVNCLSNTTLKSAEFYKYQKGQFLSGEMNTITLFGDDVMGKLELDDISLDISEGESGTSVSNDRRIEVEQSFHDNNGLNFYIYPRKNAIKVKVACKSTRDFFFVYSLQKVQYSIDEMDSGFLYISVAGFFSGIYRKYPTSKYLFIDNKNSSVQPYLFQLSECVGDARVNIARYFSTDFEKNTNDTLDYFPQNYYSSERVVGLKPGLNYIQIESKGGTAFKWNTASQCKVRLRTKSLGKNHSIVRLQEQLDYLDSKKYTNKTLFINTSYSFPNLTIYWPKFPDLFPEKVTVKYRLMLSRNSIYGSSGLKCGFQHLETEKTGIFEDIDKWTSGFEIEDAEPYLIPGNESLLSYFVTLPEKSYYYIHLAASIYPEGESQKEPPFVYYYQSSTIRDFDSTDNDSALRIMIVSVVVSIGLVLSCLFYYFCIYRGRKKKDAPIQKAKKAKNLPKTKLIEGGGLNSARKKAQNGSEIYHSPFRDSIENKI